MVYRGENFRLIYITERSVTLAEHAGMMLTTSEGRVTPNKLVIKCNIWSRTLKVAVYITTYIMNKIY